MLRTFFLQNRDLFSNYDFPIPHFGGMDSEIAELRTMTKVTRLRKQIECREEGAWMVVKDVPDESVPTGTRKVTAYGRTRRSVTRSVTSNAEFGNTFSNERVLEPLIQHPADEEEEKTQAKPTNVEITEVFDEPIRVSVPEEKSQVIDKPMQKKTSVVTLGKGNLVLIDPEDESNIKVTGIGKGKVADAVNTFEKNYEKKPKKVEFCKTEVHFAPDSGKINIVETDEKPPPTQVYRKKKKPKNVKSKTNSCLPKHYFGDPIDYDDSNLSNESDREDSRIPLTITHKIKVLPEVKKVLPTFEKTIKSESKDVKYRYSSPDKIDSDLEIEKFHIDEKDFFKKLKQPPFRERYLKETEHVFEKLTPEVSHNLRDGCLDDRSGMHTDTFLSAEKILNGHVSKYDFSETQSKDNFSSVYLGNLDASIKKDVYNSEPVLKYTELFKIPCKTEKNYVSLPKSQDSACNYEEIYNNPVEMEKSNYGYINEKNISVEKIHDNDKNLSRLPIDQDLKTNISFLGSVSPKLKNLIKNSVEHEFQLRQKQILQKRNLEKKLEISDDIDKINCNTNISSSSQKSDHQDAEILEDACLKPADIVSPVNATKSNDVKHEFQLKREQITKKLFSDPIYGSKEFEFKEMPYLLKEEPVPTPRERVQMNPKAEPPDNSPPKPKPRTIIPSGTVKSNVGKASSRHCVKSGSLSVSRKVRSKENLETKEVDRIHSRSFDKVDLKQRKVINANRVEGSSQRLTKSNVPPKKTVRGEPLRSFEKVSNGWVGHCVIPNKQEDMSSSKVTVTTKVYSKKSQMHPSAHQGSGARKSIHSNTLKSSQSSRSDTVTRGTKQFSLSKEHLSSAKLVKEISPRKSSKNLSRADARTSKVRTIPSKEGSYSRRVRRDSNDSVVQADEEVRAYMFSSRPKVLINTKKIA